MNTAMQELAHDLQESIEGLPETLRGINDLFIRKTVTDAVLIAYNFVLKRIDGELLEKEKQQIIEAFYEGRNSYNNYDDDAEQYYSETFKNDKND